MGLHGRCRDEQRLADLLVRQAACDHAEDLSFALGQHRQRLRNGGHGLGLGLAAPHELLDELPGRGRPEQRVAACNHPYAVEQARRRRVLDEETGSSQMRV